MQTQKDSSHPLLLVIVPLTCSTAAAHGSSDVYFPVQSPPFCELRASERWENPPPENTAIHRKASLSSGASALPFLWKIAPEAWSSKLGMQAALLFLEKGIG